MSQIGKADLHIHSAAGDALASVADILNYVEEETDLHLIAITDHDLLEGSLEARELAAKGGYRFQVLVGMEVTTLEGHLLAYDIEEPIRMLLPLAQALEAVQEQGGFCVVPHPMSWLTISIGQRGIARTLRGERGSCLVGLEALNPSFAGRVSYQRALEWNRKAFHLAELGGSDAHFLPQIGKAHTLFPGHTADHFRQALREHTTQASGQFFSWEEHLDLVPLAGQQMLRSLVILPSRHIRRAFDSLLERHR